MTLLVVVLSLVETWGSINNCTLKYIEMNGSQKMSKRLKKKQCSWFRMFVKSIFPFPAIPGLTKIQIWRGRITCHATQWPTPTSDVYKLRLPKIFEVDITFEFTVKKHFRMMYISWNYKKRKFREIEWQYKHHLTSQEWGCAVSLTSNIWSLWTLGPQTASDS